MSNLPIGTIQTVTIAAKSNNGYIVEQGTNEAKMETNDTQQELVIGENIDVFIYQDKRGNTLASPLLPHIHLHTYGWAEVVEVIPSIGVFVTIGTTKDMLISIDDLPLFKNVWPQAGDRLYVTLEKDKKGRLLAKPAKEHHFSDLWEEALHLKLNTPVSGRVYYTNREGSAIITTDHHRGFIHHTERNEEPRLGELVHGRIIAVKEDGSINVSLLPLKHERLDGDAQHILQHLKEQNGVIPFTDKSDPDDIRATFHMSKSAFKRALGKLMKEKHIEQSDGYTQLKQKTSNDL